MRGQRRSQNRSWSLGSHRSGEAGQPENSEREATGPEPLVELKKVNELKYENHRKGPGDYKNPSFAFTEEA